MSPKENWFSWTDSSTIFMLIFERYATISFSSELWANTFVTD